MLLFLLQDKENANMTLRQIAEGSGVSLGAVHGVVAKFERKGYLVESAGKRALCKRGTLILKWAESYSETMKDKIMIQRFRFIAPVIQEKWEEIALGEDAWWGGEPAAYCMDRYIKPERWDVYVRENANCLIATGRMIPDPNGQIYVHRKFWNGDSVPPLVVYADLLAVEDDRCREAAERIRERL